MEVLITGLELKDRLSVDRAFQTARRFIAMPEADQKCGLRETFRGHKPMMVECDFSSKRRLGVKLTPLVDGQPVVDSDDSDKPKKGKK